MRRPLPLTLLAVAVACGAPDDPGPAGTWTPPPTPTERPTPTAEPTPLPTLPPTPVPTPVPWTDYGVTRAALSGDGVDAWASLEDEALELTVRLLDGLEEADLIGPVEANLYEEAAEAAYDELFSPQGLNATLNTALSNGTADVSQRLHPPTGGSYLVEYFVWNLGPTADQARVGGLTATGTQATGSLAVPLSIETLSATVEATLHVEQAKATVAPLKNNKVEGLVPFEDFEALFNDLVASAFLTFGVSEEEQAQYQDSLDAALQDVKSHYATQTLPGGRPAMAMTVTFDAEELENGAKP